MSRPLALALPPALAAGLFIALSVVEKPVAAAPPPLASLPGAADGGFHMEPRPALDDVFGDSSDYRKTVDRFLTLADSLQRTRETFARSVQTALTALQAARPDKEKAHAQRCPEAEVAGPYAAANALGQRYLEVGRELGRRYEEVKELDRLGESVGLTPDYRAKVKRVLGDYGALLVDYREMKSAFHELLGDELRYAGCDLTRLLARAGTPADGALAPPPSPAPANEAESNPNRIASVPTEPPRAATSTNSAAPERSGIVFYVDNTRCNTGSHVELDGRALGDIPPATRTAYQTTPGPHQLCLLPVDAGAKKCGAPGTVRKSYLHEGWTIALRCD